MKRLSAIALLFLTAACAHQHQPAPSFDDHAAKYVRLALALGEHDADYVDAYYGPPEWREAVKAEKKSLAAIHAEATALREAVRSVPVPRDRMLALRRNYLNEQLGALITKTEMLQGKTFPFSEEARRLYGVTPPPGPSRRWSRSCPATARSPSASRSTASGSTSPRTKSTRSCAPRCRSAAPARCGTSSCRPKRSSPSNT
jgi:hypothetical protein